MFLLSYECALRRAELCSLSLADIDHAQRKVAIRASKSKSRLDRWLPMSKETAASGATQNVPALAT
jgi:integrase